MIGVRSPSCTGTSNEIEIIAQIGHALQVLFYLDPVHDGVEEIDGPLVDSPKLVLMDVY